MSPHFSLLMLSALLIGWAAPAAPAKPPAPEFLLAKLDSTIDFAGSKDPRLTLEQFLDNLTKKTGAPLLIKARGFEIEGLVEVGSTPIAETPLPPAKDIPLKALLRKVLDRIPIPSGATFVLRRDGIEITTNGYAYAQVCGTDFADHQVWGDGRGAVFPLVHVIARKKPLEAVLNDLAEQVEYNILVDKRAAGRAKNKVTAKLLNVTLDTAISFLTDMAELDFVIRDNVIYITTPDHAQYWRGRLKRENTRPNGLTVPRVGPGVDGIFRIFPLNQDPGFGGITGRPSDFGGAPGGCHLSGPTLGATLAMIGGSLVGDEARPTATGRKTPAREEAAGDVPRTAPNTRVEVKDPPPPPPGAQARELRDFLTKPRDFEAIQDPRFTLELLLNTFSEKFSTPKTKPPFYLTFTVNQKAFEAEGLNEVLAMPIAEKKLPTVRHTPLGRHLQHIVDRIPVASGATYVIRDGYIEITTNQAVRQEFFRDRPADEKPLPPLIHAAFAREPLDKALRELSVLASNYNIIVNPNLEQSKAPVTATFHNVPVDTAVRLLAEMSGLVVAKRGNILYVKARKEKSPQEKPKRPLPEKESK